MENQYTKVYIPNTNDLTQNYTLSITDYQQLLSRFEEGSLIFEVTPIISSKKLPKFVIWTKHFVRDNPDLVPRYLF